MKLLQEGVGSHAMVPWEPAHSVPAAHGSTGSSPGLFSTGSGGQRCERSERRVWCFVGFQDQSTECRETLLNNGSCLVGQMALLQPQRALVLVTALLALPVPEAVVLGGPQEGQLLLGGMLVTRPFPFLL